MVLRKLTYSVRVGVRKDETGEVQKLPHPSSRTPHLSLKPPLLAVAHRSLPALKLSTLPPTMSEKHTTAAAALAAHTSSPNAGVNDSAARGEDLTSLNRLLQWGAANSGDASAASAAREKAAARTPEELRAERAWLDDAFPDMFDEVKFLTSLLTGVPAKADAATPADPATLPAEKVVNILEGIEEYMADLNFAINIAKLGTLKPVVERAGEGEVDEVRAAALWVLGTSMQDVAEVKTQVVAGGGVAPIVVGLGDKAHVVRAKSVMAASALLRHCDGSVKEAFVEAGGVAPLVRAFADENGSVRRRALFMLQHVHTSGLPWVAEAVLMEAEIVKGIVKGLERADGSDCAAVEAACGGMAALVATDKGRVTEIVPSLPGVIMMAQGKATERETKQQLQALCDMVSSSIPAP